MQNHTTSKAAGTEIKGIGVRSPQVSLLELMARVCFLECLCMKLTYKKIQPPAFIFRHQIRQTGGGCWILEFLRKSFPQVGFCLSKTEADRQSAVKHRMVNYVSHIASCIHISYHHDINSSAHLSLDPTGSIFYFFCPFFFLHFAGFDHFKETKKRI